MSDEVTVEVREPACHDCNDEKFVFVGGRAVPCECAK